ncbi:RNA-binding S4 domain-containing protein [Vicingus serpentipes]|uniref:RNA-binding S4 domain-containing protein n=1 Tax=Vicingus serpentipes TaxID=1926625 RepID=A0A5C6RTN4_9FLAO|nr:RNA-binding S4 domain-containing protein [Vicingus serpentipes]TXB65836.1 RNA-binding S4 domain-containing protein [Vicingus serpentipes]
MRIDKYIWAIRLFKTRTLSSKSCADEKVKLNGVFIIKGSKAVNINDEIAIKVIPIWRTFKVLDIPKSRLGAKLVHEYAIETTSEFDLKQLELIQLENRQNKLLGIKGRPTKKDRRDLDDFKT